VPVCADVSKTLDWTVMTNATTAGPHTASYTVPAGTDRVLVVSVGTHSNGDNNPTWTVTYGGEPLTQVHNANASLGASGRAGSYIGYCDETCLGNASGNTISVQSNDSGATTDGLQARYMVLENVQQTGTNGPVTGGTSNLGEFLCNTYDTTACSQSAGFTYYPGDMVVIGTGGYSAITYTLSNNDDAMTNVSGANYGVAFSMNAAATGTVTESNMSLAPSGNGREMGAAVPFQSNCNDN